MALDFKSDYQNQADLVPQPKVQAQTFQPESLTQNVAIPDFQMDYSSLQNVMKPNPRINFDQFLATDSALPVNSSDKKTAESAKTADFNLDSQDAAPSAQINSSSMVNSSGTITQRFGNPNEKLYGLDKSGKAITHRGTDISVKENTPVAVPGEGNWVVTKTADSGYNTGWGNYVLLTNQDTGETMQFSHLNKVLVKPGQQVTGSVVGLSGSTGRSTGPHVDIEYTKNGQLQDVLTSPYRKYLGLDVAKSNNGNKGGSITDVVNQAGNYIDQMAQGMAANNVAQRNLYKETEKLLLSRSKNPEVDKLMIDYGVPPTGIRYKDLNDNEKRLLNNRAMDVMSGVAGTIQPVDRAKNVIQAAHIAKNSTNLTQRLAALDILKQEASQQLLPQELEKVKDFANDAIIKKIHQRILQEGTMSPMRIIPATSLEAEPLSSTLINQAKRLSSIKK